MGDPIGFNTNRADENLFEMLFGESSDVPSDSSEIISTNTEFLQSGDDPAQNLATRNGLEFNSLRQANFNGNPVAARTGNDFDYNGIQGVRNNPHVTPQFLRGVEAMAARLGTRPEYLLAVMSFETGGTFNPGIRNSIGATGLIQFLRSTASGLGTSTDALARMNSVEQLRFVEKYFEPFRGRLNSLESVYTAVLSGSPRTDSDSVLFRRGTRAYAQNPLDLNSDGKITAGEATTPVAARLFGGVRRVQQQLVDLGFVPQSRAGAFVDGQWGTRTSDALKDFQRSRRLHPSGLMDVATGNALFNRRTTTPPNTPPVSPQTNAPNIPPSGLHRGQRGERVRNLQESLVRLGHLSEAEMRTGPGIFGPRTENALKEFQRANRLPASGRFDAATREAMSDITASVGRGRNQNTSVTRALQNKLVELGYMTRAQVNTGYGTFGPRTEAAVKRFQADHNIRQSGALGAQTYRALQNARPTNNGGGDLDLSARIREGSSRTNQQISSPVLGDFTVTASFMDPDGHGYKSNGAWAIFSNNANEIVRITPGNRNLGIDYVTNDGRIRNWFAGEVVSTRNEPSGYGHRIIIRTDETFRFNGRNYPVYSHYAHAARAFNLQAGDRVRPGQNIGVMGNSGASRGAHVDLRTWIQLDDGRIVDISPNLLAR